MTDTLKTPILPQDAGELPAHHRQWFEQMLEAAANGHLALMSCLDAETMEPRSVICMAQCNDDGMIILIPMGHLATTDNPYDAYIPPSDKKVTIELLDENADEDADE